MLINYKVDLIISNILNVINIKSTKVQKFKNELIWNTYAFYKHIHLIINYNEK